MICAIPLRRATILPHLVADILNATKHRINFAAGATVLRAELAGEALAVAEAPVHDQPGQSLAIDGPTPWRPNGTGLEQTKRPAPLIQSVGGSAWLRNGTRYTVG